MKSSTDRIEKRIELNASPARVWRALTDYREFSAWFGVNLRGPFVAGEKTRGNITYRGYEHLVMEVDVAAMEEPTRFAFRWHPYAVDVNVDYSNEPPTLVEFRLQPAGGGTLLVVTESGFDAIPEHRRAEAFRMNDGGWTQQIVNIQKHVETNR